MGKAHVYSEEDIKFINQHHTHMSASELAAHCKVSFGSMTRQLERMNLTVPRGGGPFSQQEVGLLIKLGAEGKTPEEIAEHIQRPVKTVQKKARELGVPLNGTARHWTVEDIDYLKRSWGREGLKRICNELKRTERAVTTRAYKLGLPPCYLQSEDIPLSEFCRDTGINRFRVLQTLVPKYDFPIKTSKPGKKRLYHYVDIELILPWLESHQDLYDASAFPLFYFGEDPDWLAKKRKADAKLKHETGHEAVPGKFRADRWTPEEVAAARDLLRIGLSIEAVAERLGRSVGAVKHKITRESLSYQSPHFYQGRDFRAIRDNVESKSDAEIAKQLGRSRQSVSSHRYAMGISRKAMNDEDREKAREYIKANWKTQSDAEMAKALNRTARGVRELRLQLNIRRGKNQFG